MKGVSFLAEKRMNMTFKLKQLSVTEKSDLKRINKNFVQYLKPDTVIDAVV
jgi:hypothetical protein